MTRRLSSYETPNVRRCRSGERRMRGWRTWKSAKACSGSSFGSGSEQLQIAANGTYRGQTVFSSTPPSGKRAVHLEARQPLMARHDGVRGRASGGIATQSAAAHPCCSSRRPTASSKPH